MAGGNLFKTPPSRAQWIETVRRIEELGLDTLLVPGHLTSRLGPIAALAAAAVVTTTLRLGSLVFGNDFRVLFTHTTPGPSDDAAEHLAARGVEVVAGEVAALEAKDDRLTGVCLRDGSVVDRQGLVVLPRFVARSRVLSSLGLRSTAHPFAVGGVAAAAAINADLIAEETRQAVAAHRGGRAAVPNAGAT